MANHSLRILDGEYTIHRFDSGSKIPTDILESEFYFIGKTDEELSIVCRADIGLKSSASDSHWSCFKVLGPLDLGLTGILADIASVLAQGKISLFAVSTYDTDYILVKTESLASAKELLSKASFTIIEAATSR